MIAFLILPIYYLVMKKLPVYIQVLYGVGVSYAIFDQIFAQWVLTYYLPPEHFSFKPFLSPGFIALALVISRFVDMVADPLVGFWSDRVNTRWGRRIPFILIGTIPLALSTIAFFYPVKTGGFQTFVNLSIVGSLFFIFYTIVGAPYNALIPELSKTSDDRLNLSTWQAVFRLLYTAVAMILPGIMISVLGGGDDEKGLRLMVIFLSLFAVIGLFITSFSINERKYSGGKVSDADFKSSISLVFHDRAFLYYLGGLLFFFVGFNIMRGSINYYVTDIMGKGGGGITTASALLFGVSALFFYPVNRLSRIAGYRKLMLASLFLLILFSVLLYQTGKYFPVSFGFVIFALFGIPVAGSAFIFPPAMLSEISSRVSDKSGAQIEGIFFGIQGFFLKMAFLISIAILPIILVSGNGTSFADMLTSVPEKPEIAGIYRTTVYSVIFFSLSFIFYYIYPEQRSLPGGTEDYDGEKK